MTILTGTYAQGTLGDAVKRLALIISGQELYYPRPHQTEIYPPFKQACLKTTDDYLGNIGDTDVQSDNSRRWQSFSDEVRSLAEAFSVENERLDVAKMERRRRATVLIGER